MIPKNVLMCGGDMRSIYMAELFKRSGCEVCICASNTEAACKSGLPYAQLEEQIGGASAVVLGLPALKGDMTVNCPLGRTSINFEDILKSVQKSCVVFGGRFSRDAHSMAESFGVRLSDYSTDEVFQIENAFYTAEGAIEAIIKNTSRSIGELSVLVTGYGRISKALTRFLLSLGASVNVYARKKEQRAWADMCGYGAVVALSELGGFDVIVNTVPAELFDADMLSSVKKDVLIVDLSARPGYVNREICDKNKIRLVYLPGLPATSAPRSAGEAAGRAVLRMYRELTEGDGA